MSLCPPHFPWASEVLFCLVALCSLVLSFALSVSDDGLRPSKALFNSNSIRPAHARAPLPPGASGVRGAGVGRLPRETAALWCLSSFLFFFSFSRHGPVLPAPIAGRVPHSMAAPSVDYAVFLIATPRPRYLGDRHGPVQPTGDTLRFVKSGPHKGCHRQHVSRRTRDLRARSHVLGGFRWGIDI